MHLLSISGRNDEDFHAGFAPSDFERNHAGFKVSLSFGFGVLDVQRFVTKAKTWKNVEERVICSLEHVNGNMLEFRVPQDCSITYLEHVMTAVNVDSLTAGKWEISIVNSYNTSSILLPGRILDKSTHLTVEVMSVKFWGENPLGTIWRFKYNDQCDDRTPRCPEYVARFQCNSPGTEQFMNYNCKASCGYCGTLSGNITIYGLAKRPSSIPLSPTSNLPSGYLNILG
ncbi:endoprotease aex-5-like [Saccostrea cucullata]|uniref:endoprotease aex-5-like n=1 Tax=Saccostrea cuccullata TaxID=36930 RepID=UPI002ED44BF6